MNSMLEGPDPSTRTDSLPRFTCRYFRHLVCTGNRDNIVSEPFGSIHLDEGKDLARCPPAHSHPLAISMTRSVPGNSPPICDEPDTSHHASVKWKKETVFCATRAIHSSRNSLPPEQMQWYKRSYIIYSKCLKAPWPSSGPGLIKIPRVTLTLAAIQSNTHLCEAIRSYSGPLKWVSRADYGGLFLI